MLCDIEVLSSLSFPLPHSLCLSPSLPLLPFPSPPKVVEVNRTLTEEIDTLSDRANEALGHLQLVIEWWSEFNGNHDDVSPWLGAMEEQMTALETQLDSSASPRPCPLSLRETATVSIRVHCKYVLSYYRI